MSGELAPEVVQNLEAALAFQVDRGETADVRFLKGDRHSSETDKCQSGSAREVAS